MISAYTGLPGAGKNTILSDIAFLTIKRNKRVHLATGYIRLVYLDFKLNEELLADYVGYFDYFNGTNEMETWRDADIFFSELALDFDAHNWENTPRHIKKYLRLHRHYRVNIFGASQDFTTVDISFRRLTNHLFLMHRVIGSREPEPAPLAVKKARKPLRYLLTLQREVDRALWGVEKEHYEFINTTPRFFWGKHFDLFDTHEDVPEKEPPPLRKEIRTCPVDGYRRVRYY